MIRQVYTKIIIAINYMQPPKHPPQPITNNTKIKNISHPLQPPPKQPPKLSTNPFKPSAMLLSPLLYYAFNKALFSILY